MDNYLTFEKYDDQAALLESRGFGITILKLASNSKLAVSYEHNTCQLMLKKKTIEYMY